MKRRHSSSTNQEPHDQQQDSENSITINAPSPKSSARHPPPPPPPHDGRDTLLPLCPPTDKYRKNPFIDPPYPWATHRRAEIHTLRQLIQSQHTKISDTLKCINPECGNEYVFTFDLEPRFSSVYGMAGLFGMAQSDSPAPETPDCNECSAVQGMKPVISTKKRSINWLYLLLGQMIGCCRVEQLKYFCKHNGLDQNGTKEILVYRTSVGLCKQLDPRGDYDL